MVCKQCVRENNINDKHCVFCNANLDCGYNELAASVSTEYESNLGFAKAEAQYEAPYVEELLPGMGHTDRSGMFDDISNGTSNRDTSQGKTKPVRRKRDSREPEIIHKQNRRKEKKLAAKRQQKLYEELRSRLQEEKQESLNHYMYQGLNQDIEGEKNEEQKKRRDKGFVLSLLGITAGLVLTAGILFYMGSKSEISDFDLVAKDSIEVFTIPTEGQTYIFNALGDLLYKLDGSRYVYYTPDHTAAILYDWNTRYCSYVNAYRLKEFTTTVENFALSEDGNYLVYAISGGTNKFYLMLYDFMQDKETMIDNQEKQFDLLYILSGGKTISYITYSLSDTGSIVNLESYLIQDGGKPERIGENIFTFGISNDMENIYYGRFIDGAMGATYVRHNEVERKLSEGLNSLIYMNKDYSEVLIEDNGSYYLSSRGGERRKILDRQINQVIVPYRTISNTKTNSIISYGFKSFGEKLFLCNDNSIKYLDDTFQVKDIAIAGDNTNIMLTEDGEKLFFIDQEKRLMKASDFSGKRSLEVLASGVSEFKVTRDMSQIYFLRDKNLYFLDKNKEERLISEKVRSLCMNNNRDTVFFLKDYVGGKGTLYYCPDGLSAVPVEGGMNVTGIKEWNFGVIYQKFINNSNVVFYNREGKDFIFIMDGLNLLEEGMLY